ncbi:MAG: LysM peptidoglycan-binding domain-containing protein [Anaerolineae bacterium]|nr:LysM peptidoglycan-binding domain-containing protein [Anaerolineae bacterium]
MVKKITLGLALILILSLGIPTLVTHAQCQIPAGWQAYVIQRGDTLSRIGRNYGVSYVTLMQANCLTSTVIYPGWIIYVPASAPPPQPQPGPGPVGRTVTIYATYQEFQGGFMVWSSDSSSISAFLANSAQLRSFAASTYGYWPDPRITEPIPYPYYQPILGFGKVWNSGVGIRAALGWAVTPERGFMMTVNYATNNRVSSFSLPTGGYLVNNFNGTWQYSGYVPPVVTVVPPPPVYPTPTPYILPNPPSIGFTFQPFDGGFMAWRGDSSDIYAYIYATQELFVFQGAVYGRLGINYSLVPPAGRFRPDNGFGRVWSNYGNIRAALGWATESERGYLSVVNQFSDGMTYSFTLPDGRGTVTRINDRIWSILPA